MDRATILVLVLSTGVLALLVWFEMNSRRNETRKKQSSSPVQPELGIVGKPEMSAKTKAA